MRIIIHGFYGAGNIGDDAILQGMVDSLSREFPTSSFSVIVRSRSFRAYHGEHPLRCIWGFDLNAVYQELARCDLLLIGGGGLFQDYSGFHPLDMFNGARGAISYYSAPLYMAKALGKPVMLYALGIGPFKSREAARMTAFIASTADAVTVRDQTSLRELTKLGVTHAVLTADPVFSLVGNGPEPGDLQLLKEIKAGGTPWIGLNFRKWSFGTESHTLIFDMLLEVVRHFHKKMGARFVLIPFNQSKEEAKLCQQFINLASDIPIRLLPSSLSPSGVRAIFGKLIFTVNMRLHASLLSLCAGVPAVGIAYDPKVSGLYEEMDMADLCIPLTRSSTELLLKSCELAWHQQDDLRRRISGGLDRLQLRERQNVETVKRLLQNTGCIS